MASRVAPLAIIWLHMAALATAQNFMVVSLVSLYDSESRASIVGADSTATTFDIGSSATITQGPSMYAYASPTITSGSTVSTAFEVTAAVICAYDSDSAVCTSSYLDGSSTMDNTVTTTLSGNQYPSFTGVTITAGMSKISGTTGGNGTLMTATPTGTGTTINYSTVSVGSPPAEGSGSGLPSVTVSTTEETSGGSVVTVVTTSTSFMSTPSSGTSCPMKRRRVLLTTCRSIDSCEWWKQHSYDAFSWFFCSYKFICIAFVGYFTSRFFRQSFSVCEFCWWSPCSSNGNSSMMIEFGIESSDTEERATLRKIV